MDYTLRCLLGQLRRISAWPRYSWSSMLIGEIVRQTGVSRDTIRHYEKLGLLKAAGRPSAFNNYKSYPAATVARLKLIQQGKNLGFTLAEIADGLDLWESEQLPPAEIQARLTRKLTAIDEKIRQLEALRSRLSELRTRACASPTAGTAPAGLPPSGYCGGEG